MTDYNDGNWYVWNGGKCPVHPDSEVEVRLCDPRAEHGVMVDFAGGWDWPYRGSSAIVSFRVTKPYVEPKKPREWWLCRDDQRDFVVTRAKPTAIWHETIHVREVVDE